MPPPQVAKILARTMGVLFLVLGLFAFVPNSLIGAVGYFRTDVILNSILIAFALLLLGSTTKGEGTATTGLYFVAMMAFGIAAIGHVQLSDYPSGGDVKLFDTVACNYEDVYFMAGTAILLVICAMFNTSSRQIIRD